jgi:hypothetical protein
MAAKKQDSGNGCIVRRVVLTGIRPIMFDRYAGDNKTQLPPLKKLYTSSEDGRMIIMPAANISSFLGAQNTESASKRILGKTWKATAKACYSFVDVNPMEIPFTANGKPIAVDSDQVVVLSHVARLDKGIPNPKERPTIKTPWELAFDLSLWPNPDVNEDILRRLFDEGGICIGLGTFRGVYGKFKVSEWK